MQVGVVAGQIVDEAGAPASAGLVQVCSKDICINAKVDDSGELYEVVNQDMDAPACKYGDGRAFGKLGLPLDAGDTDLGTLTTVRLPSFEDGVALRPGQTATSAGVSLTLTLDSQVKVDTLTYEEEAEHGFRAAALPAATLALFEPSFAVGFALAPVETRICPSPALSIENSAELAAGSELELYHRLSMAVATGRTLHLAITASQILETGNDGLDMLDRCLGQIAMMRLEGKVRVETLSPHVDRHLARRLKPHPSRSILRPAA